MQKTNAALFLLNVICKLYLTNLFKLNLLNFPFSATADGSWPSIIYGCLQMVVAIGLLYGVYTVSNYKLT